MFLLFLFLYIYITRLYYVIYVIYSHGAYEWFSVCIFYTFKCLTQGTLKGKYFLFTKCMLNSCSSKIKIGGRRVSDRMVVDLPVQSVPFTTKVVSLNPVFMARLT